MSRYVLGYNPDGSKRWSDNVPAEYITFSKTLGGRQIEERGPITKQEAQLRYKAAKRLRGAALFDENGAWKK